MIRPVSASGWSSPTPAIAFVGEMLSAGPRILQLTAGDPVSSETNRRQCSRATKRIKKNLYLIEGKMNRERLKGVNERSDIEFISPIFFLGARKQHGSFI